MKTRLFSLWESINTSFWFMPSLMVVAAMSLSVVMIEVDQHYHFGGKDFYGIYYNGGPEGARYILSTIAGSVITVAGVAFSITIVALTLASTQFGPHLLRNFIKDKGNQFVLGIFIATFIYCLFTLRAVRGEEGTAFVPGLSITVALGLALLNVGVLIYFIHHVSVSIQVDNVIAGVYRDLLVHVKEHYPTCDKEPEKYPCLNPDADEEPFRPASFTTRHQLLAPMDGYLTVINYTGLLEMAVENDCVIECKTRPGKFIVTGQPLATIYSRQTIGPDEEVSLKDLFIIGLQRTPEQDAEFSFGQLVEIALRALSSGINDPFTAMVCLDWLGAALCLLSDRQYTRIIWRDKNDKPRLHVDALTFGGMVNTAFDQIRQYGGDSVCINIRMLEVLAQVAGCTNDEQQHQSLMRQGQLILDAMQDQSFEPADRRDIEDRFERLQACLAEEGVSA